MSRRLFCEWGPWAYWLSTQKCRCVRRLQDARSPERFAARRAPDLLPVCLTRHSSLICRTLGDVDRRLQENKAVNLSLAVPKVDRVLIRPGETFSYWKLIGPCTARRGYREGLVIRGGRPDKDIGGGMCQLSNLIHWMVLHTPLTVTEYHHHDGVDLFPDFGRKVPFGTGTSVLYNYIDYRFKNETDQCYQLHVWLQDGYLHGELRAERELPERYHVRAQDEYFSREGDTVYRNNCIVRTCIDKQTGKVLSSAVLKKNHARVLYDTTGLTITDGPESEDVP